MKLKVAGKPLEQIVNRLSERDNTNSFQCIDQTFPLVDYKNINDIKVDFGSFVLTKNAPNNCCILKDGGIFEINDIVLHKTSQHNEVHFAGLLYSKKVSLFTSPCDSQEIGICVLCIEEASKVVNITINDVRKKCMFIKLPQSSDILSITLLH
ncbi:hypothetical protein PPYR_15267 [Photinus pyralis]|uniref:Uncharacterized protein n=1 Tax=Photinus pyralis TaxID=7054 RepID=A0A5N3ZZ73_PHOPY|nr:hypothetical protein PPYR_15267 [Photinus pyralis]